MRLPALITHSEGGMFRPAFLELPDHVGETSQDVIDHINALERFTFKGHKVVTITHHRITDNLELEKDSQLPVHAIMTPWGQRWDAVNGWNK